MSNKSDNLFYNKIKKKPILIIANGKTAGKINWDWLKENKDKIDTFGMNSAYKLYKKLDFYPTYYANMDDIVLLSHKKQLQELLNLKKIEKCFYLRWCSFLKHPESKYIFKENETYVPIFKTGVWNISRNCRNFNSWGNTGSDCVQLAIMLGYREIYIIGVDGYVEKINEANETTVNGRKILVMNETPKDNPNYFFADYQEKGEKFNFPVADKWHVPGWDHAATLCNKLNIKLLNMSNPEYIKSIPFIKYDDFKKLIEK